MNSQTTCKRDSKRNITERKRNMEKAKRVIGIITAVLAITVGLASCADTGRKEEPKNGAYERPRTGTNASNEKVNLTVQWPSPDKINWNARNMLSEKNLKIVDESPIPVLVPNDAKMLKDGIVMKNKNNNWYAFSGYQDGVGWSIEGRKQLFVAKPGELPDDLPKGSSNGEPEKSRNIYVTDNEIGWRAGWSENGIFYGMLYGCDYDKADPRCKDDSMIRKIVENAVYVGGKGKE